MLFFDILASTSRPGPYGHEPLGHYDPGQLNNVEENHKLKMLWDHIFEMYTALEAYSNHAPGVVQISKNMVLMEHI